MEEEALRRSIQGLAAERHNVIKQLKDLEFKDRVDGTTRGKRPREGDDLEPSEAKRAKLTEETGQAHVQTTTTSVEPTPPKDAPKDAPKEAPKVQLQKNKRMFQNILGTLQGFKKQIEDPKLAVALQKRHEVEESVSQKAEQENARLADEYRRKLADDRAKAQEREQELDAQLLQKEHELQTLIVSKHFDQLSHWLLTPTSLGVPIAWFPSKRDDFVLSILSHQSSERKSPATEPATSTRPVEPSRSRSPSPKSVSVESPR